jgi:hypothetical protein
VSTQNLLYRAKEILGAHHADLSPIERKFFDQLQDAVDSKDVAAALYNPDVMESLAEGLKRVADAADKLLSGPVSEEAILLLIKNKCWDKRIATERIRDVIQAARRVRDYLEPAKKGKKP